MEGSRRAVAMISMAASRAADEVEDSDRTYERAYSYATALKSCQRGLSHNKLRIHATGLLSGRL